MPLLIEMKRTKDILLVMIILMLAGLGWPGQGGGRGGGRVGGLEGGSSILISGES